MKHLRAVARRLWNLGWSILGWLVHSVLHLAERPVADRVRRGLGQRTVTEYRPLRPGRVAIFATYPRFPLEEALLAVLRQLSERGVQLVVVATAPLPERERAALAAHAAVTLEIGNVGRDFGGYQQAVRYIDETIGLAAVERLVFLNDTLYFLAGADPRPLLDGLLDPAHDYAGANENFARHYHIGSFCFALGPRAIMHPRFRRFWAEYMPYSTRVHAIHRGEVALSGMLLASGIMPYVIYPFHRVADQIEASLAVGKLDQSLFPLPLRPLLERTDLSQTARRQQLMHFYQEHSQVHMLGLFLVKHLGMPYLKKDIVWNGIHLISDVTGFVAREGLDDPERVMTMIRQKGTPAAGKKLPIRIKSRLQLI